MFKRLVLSLSFVSFFSLSCGLHQSTGFNFVIEPGSLEVFSHVINARQIDRFGNVKKPDHFRLYAIKAALAKPNSNKVEFSIFEAVKGHYSKVIFDKNINVVDRKIRPSSEELLVVTELDVFDALATQRISWRQAIKEGLVVVNGKTEDIAKLNRWFEDIFN